MINQMGADLYRQFHTVGFYILLVFTIAFSLFLTLTQQVGGIMVTDDNKAKQLDTLSHSPWSVLSGLKAVTMSTSILPYAFIALFIIVIGYEFSQQTYKNTLLSGISRLQFIGAKYCVLLIDLLALTLVYYATSLLSSLSVGREAGESWDNLIADTIIMTLAIAFFMSVIFSIGIIMLVSTGSSIVSVVLIVIWPVAISMLTVYAHWSWLKYIDFVTVGLNVAFSIIPIKQLWPYIGVSALTLAVTIIGSSIIVHRKEL